MPGIVQAANTQNVFAQPATVVQLKQAQKDQG